MLFLYQVWLDMDITLILKLDFWKKKETKKLWTRDTRTDENKVGEKKR